MGTVNVWEKDMTRNTNFCLIQGHRVASCKALYLPLGSVFLLDILSLMNCHSPHLRSHRGSRPLPGHTHTILSGQSARYSCPASFALRKPQLPQGLLRRNFCLCPSFPNLWPHTLVHLWQATAASWTQASLPHPTTPPIPTSTPHLLHRPETSVCSEANEQESWGDFRVDGWNRTRVPPQQSYITDWNPDVCSHEQNITLFLRTHDELSHREHGHTLQALHVFSDAKVLLWAILSGHG